MTLLSLAVLGIGAGCGSSGGDESQPATPAERGEALARQLGCLGCHSTDGSKRTGPTFKGLYGSVETLDDGTTVQVDDAYLKESILDHSAKVVSGYQKMGLSYRRRVSEDDLEALLAFLKSLAE
jgi:cytochrome c oxidase subunit 2